jgi:WD40 repeat protein
MARNAPEKASAQATGQPAKAKVFISYSRRDMAFADRLEAALEARGFSAAIDRSEIYAFEDWWKRIEALISRADTVVFVISPDAVASEVALKEVAHAAALNKRFAPIVCRRVDIDAVPGPLRRLNFIFFDDANHFEAAADQLAEALTTDIDWIRTHTEISEQARRWALAKAPRGLLLRSPTLEEAEHWIASRPEGAPMPPSETQNFIEESRRAATRRRNVLTGSLTAGVLVALALAGVALWQRGIARENEEVAKIQTNLANERLVEANKERERAQRALEVSQTKESLFLAKAAREEFGSGNTLTAVQLALRGLPVSNERPFVAETFGIFLESFNEQRKHRIFLDSDAEDKPSHYAAFSRLAVFSPDGKRILATSHDDTARVWDVTTGEELFVLRGHESSVNSAVFSPDGTRILTTSFDHSARLWDPATGKAVAVLRGDDAQLRSAVFSPDGSRVLTASSDVTVRLWDAATGSALAVLRGHPAPVRSAVFSPDGTRVFTISNDEKNRTVQLWDIATGRQILNLQGHKGEVNSVGFNASGTQVVTGSNDKTARVWSSATGSEIAILRGHEDAVVHAVFSPDDRRVLSTSRDHTARLWDAATGNELAVLLRGHDKELFSAAFSPNGSLILTASGDDTVRLWDAVTTSEIDHLKVFELASAQFSPDGARILTTSKDQTIRLWDIADERRGAVLHGHEGVINSAAFSPDRARIVTASKDGTARIWDAASGRQLVSLEGHGGSVETAAFSADAKRVVTASVDGTARLWESATGREIAVLRIGSWQASAVFSPDGTRVLTASFESTRLWEAATGREIAGLRRGGYGVECAEFSPDGARVLTCSEGGETYLWDARTGQYVDKLPSTKQGHSTSRLATFSPNGARILTATDAAAYLWDLATGRTSVLLTAQEPLRFTLFSPNGAQIVTGSSGSTVARLWDATTGMERAVLRGHDDPVYHAVFSPDGTSLLTVSHDKTVRLWSALTGRQLAILRGKSGALGTVATFSPDSERVLIVSDDDNSARILWIGQTVERMIRDAQETLPHKIAPEDEQKYYLSTGDEGSAKGAVE